MNFDPSISRPKFTKFNSYDEWCIDRIYVDMILVVGFCDYVSYRISYVVSIADVGHVGYIYYGKILVHLEVQLFDTGL